eukprot:jgi/Phyca11/16223/fgenesh1_pg.PHYCAscaffold_18_\
MRLSLVVLAAVIALVSRCTAVSAASSSNQINLSESNQVLDTMQDHAGDVNRFLRSANMVDDSVDDIDSGDAIDDEERGGKTLTFAWWNALGKTADDIYKKYNLKPLKWAAYSAYLKDRGLN